MDNNDDNNDKSYYKNMMLLFTNILKYLRANLRVQYQRNIMKNAMRNHSKIFAHFTTEDDAKKTEAEYDAKTTETSKISATSTTNDDAKKAKKDKEEAEEAEEQEADDDVSYCQEDLEWAIIKKFKAYKTLIKCRDLVLNSISAVDIYIFMSTICIHIKEQNCANDFKIDFINFLGCMLFTTKQRKSLMIY